MVAAQAVFEQPSLAAGVLLLAREVLRDYGVDLPSTLQIPAILTLSESSRSQAYEMLARLREAVLQVPRSAGRRKAVQACEETETLASKVTNFLMDHPGTVTGTPTRRTYSDEFRAFILATYFQRREESNMTLEQFSQAVCVSQSTLKEWLATHRWFESQAAKTPPTAETADAGHDQPTQTTPDQQSPDQTQQPASTEASQETVSNHQMATCQSEGQSESPSGQPEPDMSSFLRGDLLTIVTQWKAWKGDFSAFCRHLRQNHRIEYGRTFVSNLLESLGLRTRTRRTGSNTPWSRDTWKRFFPGAQWLGDGTTVALQLDGRWFAFNIEVIMDPSCDAVLGINVSDVENEEALLAAYSQALDTAQGQPPEVLTLDNKPCNLTPGVVNTIAPTRLLPATPGRGQAKAGVEQTFSLFGLTAPPLKIHGQSHRELARSFLEILFTQWAWTRNGKPRKRLNGRTPAREYQEASPSPQETEALRKWHHEQMRRYEQFRETQRRRSDPVRRQILCEALHDLAIPDLDGTLATALASFHIDAILEGIAIFQTKAARNTLPHDCDRGRYLGGIIRNVHKRLEIEALADSLLQLRLRHHDVSLEALNTQAEQLRAALPPDELPAQFLERALQTDRDIDFRFHLRCACQELRKLPPELATSVYRKLTALVATASCITLERGQQIISQLSLAVAQTAL